VVIVGHVPVCVKIFHAYIYIEFTGQPRGRDHGAVGQGQLEFKREYHIALEKDGV